MDGLGICGRHDFRGDEKLAQPFALSFESLMRNSNDFARLGVQREKLPTFVCVPEFALANAIGIDDGDGFRVTDSGLLNLRFIRDFVECRMGPG